MEDVKDEQKKANNCENAIEATGAGQKLPATNPLAPERLTVDQAVLTNLLRLNHQRSKK